MPYQWFQRWRGGKANNEDEYGNYAKGEITPRENTR